MKIEKIVQDDLINAIKGGDGDYSSTISAIAVLLGDKLNEIIEYINSKDDQLL